KCDAAGIKPIVGAVRTGVPASSRRVQHVEFATRFGTVRIEANGYVDSSGDASITYEAGCEAPEPDAPVYGSLNFLIEGYDTSAAEAMVIQDVHARLTSAGD